MFGCVVSVQSLDLFPPPHMAFDLTRERGDSIFNLENIDVDLLNLSGLFALMSSSGHQAHGSRESKQTPAQSGFCEGCSFDSSSRIKASRRLRVLFIILTMASLNLHCQRSEFMWVTIIQFDIWKAW